MINQEMAVEQCQRTSFQGDTEHTGRDDERYCKGLTRQKEILLLEGSILIILSTELFIFRKRGFELLINVEAHVGFLRFFHGRTGCVIVGYNRGARTGVVSVTSLWTMR